MAKPQLIKNRIHIHENNEVCVRFSIDTMWGDCKEPIRVRGLGWQKGITLYCLNEGHAFIVGENAGIITIMFGPNVDKGMKFLIEFTFKGFRKSRKIITKK